MRSIKIVLSNERIVPNSGLYLVNKILSRSNLVKMINKIKSGKRSQKYISNGDIIKICIGLLSLGKVDFDSINEFSDDPEYLKYALELECNELPSESTFRSRLDEIGIKFNKIILAGNIDMLKKNGIEPSALLCGCVPVDIDVTPMDNSKSNKEGVSRTYKGFDGYAPLVVYIGTEGYILNIQLRQGSQHCQKGTPEILAESIESAKKLTNKSLLFRFDSGNDAVDNMALLHWNDPQLKFLIKRNPRGEDMDIFAEEMKAVCTNIQEPREGKKVYIGTTYRTLHDDKIGDFTVRMVYEIIERTTDKNGQMFLIPQIEVNTYWTSLGVSDEEVIELYHNHAICEQYHSELKTDMNVERLPSGKFDTNSLILMLAMIAFNINRIIGVEIMKGKDTPVRHSTVQRRRVRTIIENILTIAGHLTEHARKFKLSLGRSNGWRISFMRLCDAF